MSRVFAAAAPPSTLGLRNQPLPISACHKSGIFPDASITMCFLSVFCKKKLGIYLFYISREGRHFYLLTPFTHAGKYKGILTLPVTGVVFGGHPIMFQS
jgi:hypothetical protein